MMKIKLIYCRGGDPSAPELAKNANMLYGVRYDYTAYSQVYMLDTGLKPRWSRYISRVRQLKPTFALTPDYMSSDPIQLELYLMDITKFVPVVGVCPKFPGAISHIPPEFIVCESIPSQYAGWLIPDHEIETGRKYHLLGGDPRLQLSEIMRITSRGGEVVSLDGNKIAFKAAHGQIFYNGKWIKHTGTTHELARISSYELREWFQRELRELINFSQETD